MKRLTASRSRRVWLITNSPTANVDRSDNVGVASKATLNAPENRLRHAVSSINSTTRRAGLARIAWVDQHKRHTRKGCLILDESTELLEAPRMMLASLSLSYLNPLSDALQVFQSDAPGSRFGLRHHLLRDVVVDPAGEAVLLVPSLPQESLGRPCSLRLKTSPQARMTMAQPIQVSTRVDLALGVHQDIDNAQVTAQKSVRFIRYRLWKQEDLLNKKPLISIAQRRLRHLCRQYNSGARGIGCLLTVESDNAASVAVPMKRDGSQRLERSLPRTTRLVFVDISYLANDSSRFGATNFIAGAKLIIGPSLKGKPVEKPLLEGYLREPVAGRIEAAHHGEERLRILGLYRDYGY